MEIIDWLIVILPVLTVIYFGIKTCRLSTSVADFLAGRRVAGRYLLCVANLEAGQGLVSLVSMWEMYFISGFAIIFWYNLTVPLTLIFTLFGYCIYRFRETGAMTMGQFFEIRYNRKFRITAACIQIFSGIFSYSLFPAISARCIIYFCDLPEKFQIAGITLSTFVVMVGLILAAATFAVCMGGQVTVMVTDCIQALISYPLYAILVFYIISRFSWESDIIPSLLDRPSGQSMVNPYDIKELRNFNLFLVITGILGSTLGRMSWSGSLGYQSAALNPHEQKMGMMIGGFRAGFASLLTLTMAIAGIAYLTGKNFETESAPVYTIVSRKVIMENLGEAKYDAVRGELLELTGTGTISPALARRLARNEQYIPVETVTPRQYDYIIQSAVSTVDRKKAVSCASIAQQMLIPVTVSYLLPVGLTGMMCVIMLFLMFSTDTTSLHSWGSILMQDIVLPFRKKPVLPKTHLRQLRLAVCMVALCAFAGSVLFEQTDYILMFFTIATAIWIAGSGPAITLGLYWKRGTCAGAFASLITGSTIALSGIILQQNWSATIYPFLERHGWIPFLAEVLDTISRPLQPYVKWEVTPAKFPVNSIELNFLALLLSLLAYIVVSLLTCRKPFDLDKMLHRDGKKKIFEWDKKRFGKRLLGIDDNYTTGDKIIAWGVFCWTFVWGFIISFLGIIIWNNFYQWPDYWWCYKVLITMIIVPGVIALITTVWFSWGGIRDLKRAFSRLRQSGEDISDNGQVLKNSDSEGEN